MQRTGSLGFDRHTAFQFMTQSSEIEKEIVFTCGCFGDAFDVFRYSSATAEPTYLVRWRKSIGAGLTDEFYEHLGEHMDDDDDEFERWEETVREKNPPEPPLDPPPSPSFDEALDRRGVGIEMLGGEPVFVHEDIRGVLRSRIERTISKLTDDERRSLGDRPLANADDWFAREWPV
jgi:hypothetical protein